MAIAASAGSGRKAKATSIGTELKDPMGITLKEHQERAAAAAAVA
ncbi:hypothetical protein VB716_08485 [Synechococcus sp. CCY9201]|nr:hypothetical protein [Synechococcus sp. CCY9201]MEA5474257.1 hypothetical protein [Synechococcus sp. CCY9201]